MNGGQHCILNFHGIGEPGRVLEPGEAPYWISSDMFRAVLDVVVAAAAKGASILLTFDDGNRSDLEIGAAELDKRGLRATFFPLAGRLDTAGSLSEADLRELVSRGHAIGNHGFDHVDWRSLDDEGVAREIGRAREALQDAAGVVVSEAAIPFGRYDARVLRALRKLDYQAAYTSDGGLINGAREALPWLRPRSSLRGDMTLDQVQALLADQVPALRKLRRSLAMTLKSLH
jgi:peptidoglycan/xylan/chitin deacetylase (PgdA/CDA1 family)